MTMFTKMEILDESKLSKRCLSFSQKRTREPPIPEHVALAVTELSHNHAFWIRVDKLIAPNAVGFVSAKIIG
jgi:hypothetical protein